MAFVWVQNISIGAAAMAAGPNEIQTNIDTIYTALAITRGGCGAGAGWTEFPIAGGLVTDKLSAQAQQLRDAIDFAYENMCPAYNNAYQDGVDTTEDSGYQNAFKSGYDGSNRPGYASGDDGTYNSGFLSGYDANNYPGVQSEYYGPGG